MRISLSLFAVLCLVACGGSGPVSDQSAELVADVTAIHTQMPGNRCLDVSGGRHVPGTLLQLWDCVGVPNQRFHFIPATGEIKAYDDTMCLDAAGGKGENGDAVIIWPCHGGPNQKWAYDASSGNITGVQGRCLSAAQGNSTNGTTLVLWNCYGPINQKWTLGKAATPSATPVNGACGPANALPVSSAPGANLCSSGAPSAVSGTGAWTWNCTGSNGGTSASCSAPVASSCDVTLSPGSSIQAAIDAHPAGTKFCLPQGTWRGQAFTLKNNDQLLGAGADKTLLDGTGTQGTLTDGWHNSVTGVVFDGITVSGYQAEHLGNPDCEPGGGFAQLLTGNGWVVRNSVFKSSGCTAVAVLGGVTFVNNQVTNNQKLGVFCFVNLPGFAGDMLFQGNELDHNNQGHYPQNNTPAGIKCYAFPNTSGQHVTVNNNYVHDNLATGIWLDTSISNAIIQGNTVINNAINGIHYEVSPGPCDISHNVVNGNGAGPYYPDVPSNEGRGFGIFISTSGGCNVHDNNVDDPGNTFGPMFMSCDSRGDAPSNPCQNVTFHNNTLSLRGNSYMFGLNNNSRVSLTGSSSDSNRFFVADLAEKHFLWNTAPYQTNDFSTYRAATGQDAHSTLATGNARVAGCLHLGCTGSGW